MYPRCSFAAGALVLLVAFPVIAAENDSDVVVVTATRFSEVAPNVAANISVITRQDISNTPTQNIPDVLSVRAGIVVSQLGSGTMGRNASVDMRGFGSTGTSNTLVLVDGQRVNPIDMGSIIWSSIPLESVERIEIIRGSGTVLYGDGATGGVINIVTNKTGARVAGVSAALGSYGYKDADIQLANGNDTAYYKLFVNHSSTDGYRENSQQDQQTASGRVGWLLDRGEIFTDFAIYKESEGLAGSIFSAAYRDDPRSTRFPSDTENRDGYRVRPGITYQINNQITFEAEAGVEHQTLRTRMVSYASDRDRDTVSLTPRFRWQHGLGYVPSETVIGADFYNGDVSSANVGAANQGASQRSLAFYLQNVTDLTESISVNIGMRQQRVKQSANQDYYSGPWGPSPSMSGDSTRTRNAYDLGLAYAGGGWRLYGKTGTTFRFANTDELFGYDVVNSIPAFAGDIKPQHGRTNEVGGNANLGAVKIRASVYQLDLTDEIGYDGAVGANTNFSPTRRKGAEFEADWKIAEKFLINGSYAYTEAYFRAGAYAGMSMPLVPRNQASLRLTWDTGSTGTYSGTVRYVGERRFGSDFDNVHGMLAGYTTVDLQSVWDLKPWKITAKILNAFDKKYSSFAGYSSFYNDTYYYPADGRSLFVSGRYDF